MKTLRVGWMLALGGLTLWVWPACAQSALDALQQRLDRLEKDNAELRDQVRLLRREVDSLKQQPDAAPDRLDNLEEKVEIQAGRLAEHDLLKLESSQRAPLRLTGMALFNAFRNSRHGGGADNPTVASINRGPGNSGATLRQSVIGLEFDGPEAVRGGKIRGSLLLDLFSGTGEVLNQQVRLRTASIEAQWATRGFMVGQEKPIFAPREPNSLAQVGLSPLTGAGNLWRWRPQVRFEQRLKIAPGSDLRARIGVSQTDERYLPLPGGGADLDIVEPRRPGLEGHFQVSHRFDDQRRAEFAPGFHWSTSHVGGLSVPSNVFSIDWFVNPHPRVEFTGNLFTGKNLAKLGAGGIRQGLTILRTPNLEVIPVRSRGGWVQVTLIATSRVSFNLYGGQDDPNNRDIPSSGAVKNIAYATNVFYRLAPNVVIGAEVSQVRTRYLAGQRPINNHYDLAVAYLF